MSKTKERVMLKQNTYKWMARILRKFPLPQPIAMKLEAKKREIRVNLGIKNHKDSFSTNKSDGSTCILFILWMPQLWNSQRTVYEAAVENPEVDVKVVVAPYESKLSNGKTLHSYDFYKEKCPNAIEGIQNGTVFDIRTLNPDIIIRQSPYDSVFPEEYSMANLAKIAKTCYIPYSYNYTPNHLHIEYNVRLLSDLYAVFSDFKTNYNYCINEHNRFYPDLHVYYCGFPRFDILRSMRPPTHEGMTFMWVPRWSTDAVNNDGTSFFEYKDKLLEYFSSHSDLNLIIRPHPFMFGNFIKLGLMTEKEVSDYLERVNALPNVSMDDNMDYLETFEKTNALIADMSSINYEFYLTGRPIIFCGDPDHCNTETTTMNSLVYLASNWGEIRGFMEDLVVGKDPNYELRKEDIAKVNDGLPENIGKAIVEKCIDIARGISEN